jgi:VWFA-related protein
MKLWICLFALTAALVAFSPALAQQAPAASTDAGQMPTVKTTVDEVVLDFIARDKKGKPITDLKQEDLTVMDNGAKETLTSFRLVQGAEAINQTGTTTKLDPLRQLRLVTLAFEAMGEPDQRKRARTAATDLINGEQGANVFYSVVVIDTRLLLLQQFTSDKDALAKAIDQATSGTSSTRLLPESDKLKSDLRRYLGGQTVNGADQPGATLTTATQTANQPVTNGGDAVQAKLASIMLNMLSMDAAMASQGARLSIAALESLVRGLQSMPGRKSVLYFTWGLYVTPELDVPFRNLESMANRGNITFYSVDTRGVMTGGQNAGATDQLSSAAMAGSGIAVGTGVTSKNNDRVTTDQMKSSDNAEAAGRANVQLPIRDLAEATGGFLIGESNDLRTPLRRVNEEISSYYELTYNPHIENYDGSFRKLKLDTDRKNLVLHARNGYFALPPEARAAGLAPFEMPLLKAISDGKISSDVEFRAGTVLLQPGNQGTDLSLLVEVPLHGLQPKTEPGKNALNVHFSLGALVKDSKGDVVEKVTHDRSFQVTADQLKMGNFVEKMPVVIAPGKYTLETAVMDMESGKIGTERTEFTVAAKAKGVELSSITMVRSFAPAKGQDPNEPFQFQGQVITPTLSNSVPKVENSFLRLFFVVYRDASIPAKPTMEIELLQNGKSLTKVPLPLPDADAQGRIPYVMTIPAAAIPPGVYEVRATAKQGDTTAESKTEVKIEAM